MFEILYSLRFKVELEELVINIKNNSSDSSAEMFVESILSSIKLLSHFPRIGILRATDKNGKEYHLYVTGHYFIYYSVYESTVNIDGIKDCSIGFYNI